MSLQSDFGNLGHGLENLGQVVSGSVESSVEAIIGSVKTGLGNIWAGGFAGISEELVNSELVPALNSYCDKIEGDIAAFNPDGDITQTFAGTEIQGAIREYIGGIQSLLIAYVSTMRAESERADQALNEWQKGTSDVSKGISSNAQEIRSQAESIKLD